MLSDTHCHLSRIKERGEDVPALLSALEKKGFRFVFDIGTEPGDFSPRLSALSGGDPPLSPSTPPPSLHLERIPPFLHFSCGIWPDTGSIASRGESLAALESDVSRMIAVAESRTSSGGGPVLCALGECGIDRHWNGESAAAGARGGVASARTDDRPGTTDVAGEEELFGLQIMMARRYGLPLVIHSREAFGPTYAVLKDCGYFRGVIHCFSYGIEEARLFLDLGFLISFPGSITFAKKPAERERIAELVRYVPRDMLLLETDAPYLTPVPVRGTVNTPLKIEHTYSTAAGFLGVSVEELAECVYVNALSVFSLQKQG